MSFWTGGCGGGGGGGGGWEVWREREAERASWSWRWKAKSRSDSREWAAMSSWCCWESKELSSSSSSGFESPTPLAVVAIPNKQIPRRLTSRCTFTP